MAEKAFIKSLENFKGLDLKTSKLQGSQENGQLLTNLEYSESRGLRGRTGCFPIGQAGAFTALHTYNYYDSVTGATVQELLAVNDTLWRLKKATLTVTGGANVNWQNTYNSSAGKYRFVIQNNTTPYVLSGNNYYDLGTGLESENITTSNPKLITIEALRSTIDANATLACALPAGLKFGQVNGDQTSAAGVITVFNTHNYAVNDWYTCWDFGTGKLVARRISATTGTTLTFDTNLFGPITLKDNQVLGPMASPATSIEVRDSTALTTSINFSYWDLVPYTTWMLNFTDETPFKNNWASRADANYRAPVLLNTNNCCYIYAGSNNQGVNTYAEFPFKYDGLTCFREGVPKVAHNPSVGAAGALTGTYKYRCQVRQISKGGVENLSRASPPIITTPITLAAQRATLEIDWVQIGLTKDISSLSAMNKNGNQVGVNTLNVTTVFQGIDIGQSVWAINRATTSATMRRISNITTTSVTISGAAIDSNNGDVIQARPHVGFNYGAARVAGGGPFTNSTITVLNTQQYPNTLKVGDIVAIKNTAIGATGTVPNLVTRTITAVTATTITWSGGDCTVASGDTISAGLVVDIYRTKAGGNLFYYLDSYPNDPYSYNNAAIDDNIIESYQTYQLIEPPLGKEQDLPPKARFACNHQGTRCSAGDDENPNTVSIYSTLDPEAVPAASNSFDVPSQINGPITAIGSDDDDRLAIFKDHAYYQASGALDDGAFSVQTIREGDFGISSHRSLQKVNGALIGVGPLGAMGVKGGRLLPGFGEGIYPPLANNANIRLGQAVAINDYSSRHYLFFVPSADMTASGYHNSLTFALDYVNNGAWVDKSYAGMNPQYGMDAWFDRDYTRGYDIGGDMAMYNNVFHHLALGQGQYPEQGHVFKRLMIDTNLTLAPNLYWDVNQPIQYVFQPQWLAPDSQISVDKEYQWFKLYASPSTYELERFTSFTATLATYGNFNEAAPVETLTLPTITSTAFESRIKLKSTKLRAISFKVVLVTGGQCLYITGFEYVVSLPYIPEVPRTT